MVNANTEHFFHLPAYVVGKKEVRKGMLFGIFPNLEMQLRNNKGKVFYYDGIAFFSASTLEEAEKKFAEILLSRRDFLMEYSLLRIIRENCS